jgi:hypothetical protein
LRHTGFLAGVGVLRPLVRAEGNGSFSNLQRLSQVHPTFVRPFQRRPSLADDGNLGIIRCKRRFLSVVRIARRRQRVRGCRVSLFRLRPKGFARTRLRDRWACATDNDDLVRSFN